MFSHCQCKGLHKYLCLHQKRCWSLLWERNLSKSNCMFFLKQVIAGALPFLACGPLRKPLLCALSWKSREAQSPHRLLVTLGGEETALFFLISKVENPGASVLQGRSGLCRPVHPSFSVFLCSSIVDSDSHPLGRKGLNKSSLLTGSAISTLRCEQEDH